MILAILVLLWVLSKMAISEENKIVSNNKCHKSQMTATARPKYNILKI